MNKNTILVFHYVFFYKCTIDKECSPFQFGCASGQCISASGYCDFIEDCDDKSDEIYCGKITFHVN